MLCAIYVIYARREFYISVNCEYIIQFGDTKNFVHYIFNTFYLRVLYSLSLLKIVFIGG